MTDKQFECAEDKILLSAVWFGLMTGLAEAAFLILRHLIFNKPFFLGRQFIWMAPLFYVILFTFLGIILTVLARFWPRIFSWRLSIMVYSFSGYFSLLILLPWLKVYASVVLAVGLAVQTSRIAVKYPHIFFLPFNLRNFYPRQEETGGELNESDDKGAFQLDRRGFLLGAGAVLAGLIAIERGSSMLTQWGGISRLPSSSPEAPNLLLIVMDTVRAQSTSLYGYRRATTPFLDSLSQKGIQFSRAFSTSNWTLPSHASMFTGRWHHELSVGWEAPLDETYPTLAEILYDQGYLTSGFVANTEYCSYDFGLNRGFLHYEDYGTSTADMINSASLGRLVADNPTLRRKMNYFDVLGRKNASSINQDFLRWISNNDQRPFFSFINYYDAHDPYLPPHPYDNMFGPTKRDILLIDEMMYSDEPVEIPPRFIQAELDAYDGAIAYIDRLIGSLAIELQKMGELENTLLIITSDHGEEFGEHGFYRHTNSLYIPTLFVPLTILFPGRIPQGRIINNEISLRNLPATIQDLLGLDAGKIFPGDSLSRTWNSGQSTAEDENEFLLSEVNYAPNLPERFPVSKGDMKSLINEGYHYILNGDLKEELYNYEDDPWEEHDMSNNRSASRILNQFRAAMDSMFR